MNLTKGTLFVISGPSGVGKGTVLERVFSNLDRLIFSVSATTRLPREGETEGVDYFFVTKSQFEEMLQKDEFLEHAHVHGNFYGTPRHFVDSKLDEGKDVILDIDVQGALQVMDKRTDAVFVFIAPPCLDAEILRKRLLGRNTEKPETIEIRVNNARTEMQYVNRYEYVVFNETVEAAAENLTAIIRAERCRTEKILPRISGVSICK